MGDDTPTPCEAPRGTPGNEGDLAPAPVVPGAPPLQPRQVACPRCSWVTTWWWQRVGGLWRGWCGRCGSWLRGNPDKGWVRIDPSIGRERGPQGC